MPETEFSNQPERPSGYGLNVTIAAAAASCGVASVWMAEYLKVAHPEFWLAGSLAAGWATIKFTRAAMRTERQTPRASFVRAGFDTASRLRNRLVAALKATKTRTSDKTATPDKPRAPEVIPIDVQRIRLRKAGLSDSEVERFLRDRENAAHAPAPGTRNASLGAGVATGVLNNLDAVMIHLRSLVPSVKFDLTRILDRNADSATRISGAVSLGLKAAAAIVVGYFVYLEALQFRSAAYKSWAEACIERQKNAINFSTLSELESGSGPGRDLDKECAQ